MNIRVYKGKFSKSHPANSAENQNMAHNKFIQKHWEGVGEGCYVRWKIGRGWQLQGGALWK